MNAPEKFLTAHLGEAEVRVPERAAIAAYIELQLDLTRPLSVGLATTVERIGERLHLPEIGEPWEDDGLFAGVTLHGDRAHALILLAGDMDDAPRNKAVEWAKAQGGDLPSRFDGLVLFKNLKREFKEATYWLNEQHADDAGYAWFQNFPWGNQSSYHQDYELRARAVRRVPI